MSDNNRNRYWFWFIPLGPILGPIITILATLFALFILLPLALFFTLGVPFIIGYLISSNSFVYGFVYGYEEESLHDKRNNTIILTSIIGIIIYVIWIFFI